MNATKPTAARSVVRSDTHWMTTWLAPCSIMGDGWYRVWFSISTPRTSGAYSWATIKGTDSSAVIREHLESLRQIGIFPQDLSNTP